MNLLRPQENEGGGFLPRSLNERRILSTIRQLGEAPKADLARACGLSPTAVGVIIRQLEIDGLVCKGEPQRGRVGQPSVPYSIAPDGAFALGLKIGRRSAEAVLLDAQMGVVDIDEMVYPHPDPQEILKFGLKAGRGMISVGDRAERLVGVGVAAPTEIWCWADEMGAPEGALNAWREFDAASALGAELGASILPVNDATAACAAQLALSAPTGLEQERSVRSFVYFFVGWFIGGGVALDGQVVEGRAGGAGALGSMLVGPVGGKPGVPQQLIRIASLYCLEREYVARGGEADAMWRADADWSEIGAPLEAWCEEAAAGVAQAIANSASLFDFEAAVVDGSFPPAVRREFVRRVRSKFEKLDRQGLPELTIQEGAVGRNARAIGAACLPLLQMFNAGESEAAATAG